MKDCWCSVLRYGATTTPPEDSQLLSCPCLVHIKAISEVGDVRAHRAQLFEDGGKNF